ncbi:MAG: sugar phosphate isomerase/epimerase family protein [Gemmataceae bacterium]
MMRTLERRDFLRNSVGLAAGLGLGSAALSLHADDKKKKPLFLISLAQWSLHKAFFAKKLDPLEFAVIAKKEYDIDAVEYVNQFYKGKAKDKKFAAELKKRADDNGVKSVLIMCDGEGALGDPDEKKRKQAVENHYKWVELAKFLGCHSIRVNAQSKGTPQEQMGRAADGLRKLTEFGAKHEINLIVENHGGLSSNGKWLTGVMRKVDHPRCGTLPDFGNFGTFDRYEGVKLMMPFAKGVSAKSHDFDDNGNEKHTDYRRMMKIVLDAGYHGRVGIEYEGGKLSEPEGIRATKRLLERVRAEMGG